MDDNRVSWRLPSLNLSDKFEALLIRDYLFHLMATTGKPIAAIVYRQGQLVADIHVGVRNWLRLFEKVEKFRRELEDDNEVWEFVRLGAINAVIFSTEAIAYVALFDMLCRLPTEAFREEGRCYIAGDGQQMWEVREDELRKLAKCRCCEVGIGEKHFPGCLAEQCPNCGDILVRCQCFGLTGVDVPEGWVETKEGWMPSEERRIRFGDESPDRKKG